MKRVNRSYIISILIFSLITIPIFAEPVTHNINAILNEVNLFINNNKVITDSIFYNDTIYIPARIVSNALGKDFYWDKSANIITIKDKPNIVQIQDNSVKGRWRTVDIVDNIESFNQNEKHYFGEFYIKDIELKDDGEIFFNGKKEKYSIWGDGIVFFGLFKDSELGDKRTAGEYNIKLLNGQQYMFFEYKNGDYMRGSATPQIYVLVREVSSNTKVQQIQPAPTLQPIPTPATKYMHYSEYKDVVKIGSEIYSFQASPELIFDNNNNCFMQFDSNTMDVFLSIAFNDYEVTKGNNQFVSGVIGPNIITHDSKKFIERKEVYTDISNSYTRYTLYNSDRSKSYSFSLLRSDSGVLYYSYDFYIPMKDLMKELDLDIKIEIDEASKLLIYTFGNVKS